MEAEKSAADVPEIEGGGAQDDDDEMSEKALKMDVSFHYVKERKEFGRPTYHFKGVGPQRALEQQPDEEKKSKYVREFPPKVSCQAAIAMSEHQLVTDKTIYKEKRINHYGGAWPKYIDEDDIKSVLRYQKKMSKSEDLLQILPTLHKLTHRCCRQNEFVNIYTNFFEPPEWDEPEEFSPIEVMRTNEYLDPSNESRPVQHVSWEPFNGVDFVTAYSYLTYMRNDYFPIADSYIWNVEYTDRPLSTLKLIIPAVKLVYNPKLPDMLLGGLMTGQLCYWDTRADDWPQDISEMNETFREPPSGVLWTHSRTGFDCFAASPDGQIVWYDVRNFDEPLDRIVMDFGAATENEMKVSRATGISALEFEHTIPTKYMVGTETGAVFVGNRKGKLLKEKLGFGLQAFPSPIRQISRNPAYLKCFLAIGDFQFRIFAEDCKESYIFWPGSEHSWVTAGMWSHTRQSVFFITKSDGCFDLWDLLREVDKPVATRKLSDMPLRCLECHTNGEFVLMGADDGFTSLVRFSSHYYKQEKHDRVLLSTMLDREAKREKLVDTRNREVKMLQKQREKISVAPEDHTEEDIRNTYENFMKSLQNYDIALEKRKRGEEEKKDEWS